MTAECTVEQCVFGERRLLSDPVTERPAMRRDSLSIVAVACSLALWTSTLSAQEKVLDGLQYGGRATTMLGCLEDSAKYLGIDITPGWLYGGTGHAFVMCLGEDLCPSGPSCWKQGPVHRLSRNLPFRIEGVAGPKATPELLAKAWDHVRKSIDQGYPCYGWHWELVLVKGHDQDGYLYSTIRDPVASFFPHSGAGEDCWQVNRP